MLNKPRRPLLNIIEVRMRLVNHKTQLCASKKNQTIKSILTTVEQIRVYLIANHTAIEVEIHLILVVLLRIHFAS